MRVVHGQPFAGERNQAFAAQSPEGAACMGDCNAERIGKMHEPERKRDDIPFGITASLQLMEEREQKPSRSFLRTTVVYISANRASLSTRLAAQTISIRRVASFEVCA
jgi:hypothetical protein